MKRILLAGLSQETNSFAPVTKWDKCWRTYGDELRDSLHYKNYIEEIEKMGWEYCLADHYRVAESGPILDEIADSFLKELFEYADQAGQFDGIFLDLHGATQFTGHEDGCSYLLEQIRAHFGNDIIIVAATDMHGNITPKMSSLCNIISGYLTYPHKDVAETSTRAARQGIMLLQGKPVFQANVRIPMIVPAEGYSSDYGVFKEQIEDYGQKLVEEGKIIDFSVYQMQPWLDVSCGGSTVLVSASDKETAAKYARDIAHRLFDLRKEMKVDLYDADDVIDKAIANTSEMPVILVDSADSSNAGSSADSSFVLEKLLTRGETIKTAMAVSDPTAVKKAFELGVGATGEFELGGYYEPDFHHPVKVTAYVKSLHDGIYKLQYSGKGMMDVGKSAVLQIGNIDCVVYTRMRNTSDPQSYRAFGVEPAFYRLVIVKSANQYKEPYSLFSTLFYPTDTPGSSSANLTALPFKNLPRPFYPFDDIDTFDDTAFFR